MMSNGVLYEDDIETQFGLISIRDFGTEDHPRAESGEEEVLALPGHVFVATQVDSEGEVRVEVHVGECEIPDARVVFDGFMVFQSRYMCITGAADPDEETILLPRTGQWKVKVYVHGSPTPSYVGIFIDLNEWLDSGGILPD